MAEMYCSAKFKCGNDLDAALTAAMNCEENAERAEAARVAAETAAAGSVKKSGDTMTGALNINSNGGEVSATIFTHEGNAQFRNSRSGSTFSTIVVPDANTDNQLAFVKYRDGAVALNGTLLHSSNFSTYAAPAGYGLGSTKPPAVANISDITTPGFYRFWIDANTQYPSAANDGVDRGWHTLFCSGADSDYGTVFVEMWDKTPLSRVVMTRYSGAWQTPEWVNPPMLLGVEYRTTERYMGKPVYAKLVDCGLSVVGDWKHVSIGVENFSRMVSLQGNIDNRTFPVLGNQTTVNGAWNAWLCSQADQIDIWAGSSMGNRQVYVLAKYTKTTD